jgi:hypothetical protein
MKICWLPPLSIDNDVVRCREAFSLAMLSLHRGEREESTFLFWGRYYRISVEQNRLICERVTGENSKMS